MNIIAPIEELVCRKSTSFGKLGNLKFVVHLQLNLLISWNGFQVSTSFFWTGLVPSKNFYWCATEVLEICFHIFSWK